MVLLWLCRGWLGGDLDVFLWRHCNIYYVSVYCMERGDVGNMRQTGMVFVVLFCVRGNIFSTSLWALLVWLLVWRWYDMRLKDTPNFSVKCPENLSYMSYDITQCNGASWSTQSEIFWKDMGLEGSRRIYLHTVPLNAESQALVNQWQTLLSGLIIWFFKADGEISEWVKGWLLTPHTSVRTFFI